MAITADGKDAASEIGLVDSRVQGLSGSQQQLEGQSRRTGQSAAELAKQQRATADAINAVTRATNPAVGSQRALETALRKAESAYVAGKISAEAYARAQEIGTRATFNATTSARQMQQGTRQLGLQFNDLGTQIASGFNPMTAFIQQAGQMGYAMSLMGGTAGKVGSILAGPWGAALVLGLSLLGSTIGKLLGAADAHKKHGEAVDISKLSLDELTDAIDKNDEALRRSILTTQQSEQKTLDDAEARRKRALQIRQETVALLEQYKAAAANAPNSATGPGPGGEIVNLQIAADLEKQLKAANEALAKAQQGVSLAQVPIAQRQAKEATDKSAKIQGDYNRAVAAATTEFLQHGRDLNKLNAALTAAEQAQIASNKALQEANRKPRQVSLGDQVSATIGQNILAAAQSHLGQTERAPTLQQFLQGQHIDPEKEAWCAAFINAVLASQGIAGTGTNRAKDFLGFGSATQTPQKGDIVVLRSSASPSGAHVGFFAGEQGGRVQVTGGNQGRVGGGGVTTSSFAKSDVLGFRRAPTAADAFKDEEQAAKKAQEDAEKLAAFGKQAQTEITQLANKALPTGTLQQANAELAKLDQVMAEVEKRKPPNLEELRKDAAQAKIDIQNGITKPFNDFVQAQQQSLQIEKLRAAGMTVEAETLQEIYRLQAAMGRELLPEEISKVLELTQARQAEQEQLKKAQDEQRKYIQDLNQYKDLFRTLFTGDPKDIKSFPKRFLQVVQQQSADKLFDQVFGGLFKSLEDDKTGVNKVRASNLKLSSSADKATNAILQMAQAAGQAASGGGLGSSLFPVGADGVDPLAPLTADTIGQGITDSPIGALIKKLFGQGIGINDESQKGIGSTFIKSLNSNSINTGSLVAFGSQMLNSLFGGVGQQGGKVTGGKISDVLGSIGQTVGQFVPQLAAAQAITSVFSKIVGLPNFAGGSFGIGGNLIAKLLGFGKRIVPKGGVSISDAFGQPVQGGDPNLSSQFVSSGTGIQDTLQNIAQQLGGALGQFSVAIGTFDGDIRVNTNGQVGGNSLNRKTPGTFDFNQDMQAAMSFAIMDAIKDGAVTGLSAAVQKALQSSPDLDRALREALKVEDLETLLAGVGGTLDRTFRAFEQEAQDRLRIAQTYGLDLVKTEQINAEQRAKVFDDVMKQRVGDLQNFLDDLKFGSLFEGTAAEQRTALLAQIATVRTQADQGVEGAASQLASLERNLLDVSKNAYGTAGPEYAADRAAAEADAERVIAEETARAREAQQRAIDSLNAATQQNALTDETNNLLTQTNNLLSIIAGTGAVSSGYTINGPSLLDRTTTMLP